MTARFAFSGPDGMARKLRLLTANCEAATAGFARTLLIAVSAPDPLSTPGCRHAGPRGIRVQTLDVGMRPKDLALLVGTIYGLLDRLEDAYTLEFGEDFRGLVDEARSLYGHETGIGEDPDEPWTAECHRTTKTECRERFL